MRDDSERCELGKRPDLKWIKLSQLFVPTDYQRPTKSESSRKTINHIQAHFNWAECGALIVCPLAKANPPQYAIIDGQHRFRAAVAHGGVPELPCIVIPQKMTQEQAVNFININRHRVKLHMLHQHRAAVVAGDPDAVSVADILKKANIDLAEHSSGKKGLPPRTTQSIQTLYNMINVYSEKQIIWALTIIPEAYGDTPGVLRASLMKAMAEWIRTHPDTDRDTMIMTLQDIDLDDMEKDARAYRAIEGKRMPEAFMMVIEKKYNAAKRERQRA
jgi:hypothetical protein